jgi:hypothetical protein
MQRSNHIDSNPSLPVTLLFIVHSSQWRYAKVLTEIEAAAVLTEFKQQITVSQQYSQQSFCRYGDEIVSRWRQRSQQKRAKLLCFGYTRDTFVLGKK